MATIVNFSSKRSLMDQFRDNNVTVFLPFRPENFKCSDEVTCECKSKKDRRAISVTRDNTLKKVVKEVINGDNI